MKNNKNLIVILLILMSIYCCNKSEMLNEEEIEFEPKEQEITGMKELGKELNDPYSLENMTSAFENLKNQNKLKSAGTKSMKIESTHLYVRFLPKDENELNELMDDSTLLLFDYPLHYEIKKQGHYYHDPEIPEDKPTWLYTVVPINYDFPKIKYELIYKCYFPEKDADTSLLNNIEKAQLEEEAFIITGNKQTDKQLKSTEASWKNPSGYIRVRITEGYTEGVIRVKVATQRWTNTGWDWTDDNGYYYISNAHYKHDCNYSVKFENETGFKIWGEFIFFTTVNYDIGKHSPSGYDKDIWKDYDAWKFATVNNAAYRYRNLCDQLSHGGYTINKPPSDLRIWVLKQNSGIGMGSAPMLRRTWGLYGLTSNSVLTNFFLKANGLNLVLNYIINITKYIQPDLTISVNNDNSSTTSQVVSSLVFHESSHASHWSKVGSSYWVKYINYIATYGAYGNGTGQNAGYCGVGEMWGNYFGNLICPNRQFSLTNGVWFDPYEDWFNPGFLRDVDNLNDMWPSKIFSAFNSSTTSIGTLVSTLKTITENDNRSKIDNIYNNPNYNDWP